MVMNVKNLFKKIYSWGLTLFIIAEVYIFLTNIKLPEEYVYLKNALTS